MRNIKKYSELTEYINAFSEKNINLLIMLSRGGLGKSTIMENVLMEHDPLMFKGHVTPLSLYKQLYDRNEEENNFLLVLDDVDSLLNNKINITILKQTCETKENKTIYYSSSTPLLGDREQYFETSCKVLILLNDIETFADNISLKALLSRAHILNFDPSTGEILKYMSNYAKDTQILDFIKKYADVSNDLNLRTYEKAKELKKSKLNWEEETIDALNIDKKLVEIDILLNKYDNDIDRLKHFSGSRMTYYRAKKEYLKSK